MTGEHYTNTSGILINQKIIASALKTIIQTLDEKIYGILMGALAHSYMRFGDFATVSVVSGSITLTGMSARVSASVGTTDTIATINVSPTGVQMIILKATVGHTLTIQHNVDNVLFSSGTDFTLQGDKHLVLFADPDTGKLYDTSTSVSGGGGGGVSSVGLTLPAIFGVAGSPVTTSGTIIASLATQVKNKIWAGPVTGANAAPTFRLMDLLDLPVIATNKLLGNSSGSGASPVEITVGSGLSMAANVLTATGGGGGGDGGSSGNIITNGGFSVWERGIAAAPDGWTLTGASATIAQEATIIKHGLYSAKLTRVGTDCNFSQDVYAKGGSTYMRGRTYIFGAWVYATVASRARLRMNDGTTTTFSSYHSGGSGWEWLTVSATIAVGATAVQFGLQVDTGNTSAYMDSATVAEGSTLTYPAQPALSVNQYPRRATMWHDEATVVTGNGITINVQAAQVYSIFSFQSTSANGDTFTHGFWLTAGTYTLSILGIALATGAKIDWYIDGVLAISAQDWYSGSNVFNSVKTGSVTVVGDGYHVIKGVINGRNASNTTGFNMDLTKYWLKPATD